MKNPLEEKYDELEWKVWIKVLGTNNENIERDGYNYVCGIFR